MVKKVNCGREGARHLLNLDDCSRYQLSISSRVRIPSCGAVRTEGAIRAPNKPSLVAWVAGGLSNGNASKPL